MSDSNWQKNSLTQAIGLAATGAAVATGTHAAELSPSITFTTYDLNMRSDDFSGGAYGHSSDSTLTEGREDKLKVTIPVAGNWDVGVSLTRSNDIETSTDEKYQAPYGTSTEAKTDYDVIDFEAGYNTQLGNAKGRLSVGLRYIDLDQSIDANFSYFGGKYTFAVYSAEHDLEALGVRVSSESTLPLGAGFSVSGTLGASLLYGDRESDYDPINGSSVSEDEEDTISEVDGEVTLNFDLSPKTDGGTSISIGYTFSEAYDLIQTDTNKDYGDGLSDVKKDGWFVRLSATF